MFGTYKNVVGLFQTCILVSYLDIVTASFDLHKSNSTLAASRADLNILPRRWYGP